MREVMKCALAVALVLAGCSSGDDDPEVAGVQIDREDEPTTSTTERSTTTSSSTATTTTSTSAVAPTTTTAPRPAATTTTTRSPARPATTTTTTAPPPPVIGPPQPGRVEGTVVIPEGTRARLFLVDTNTESVRASDELASSGGFGFGDVPPGDYRVDTQVLAPDGASTEERGADFQLGQASTVRLTCDPRCA